MELVWENAGHCRPRHQDGDSEGYGVREAEAARGQEAAGSKERKKEAAIEATGKKEEAEGRVTT